MRNAGFTGAERKSRISCGAVAAFALSLLLCSVIVVITVVNRSNVEKLEMEQLIMEKSVKINEVISKLLYKTETLAALVVQDRGDMDSFERVAATVIDDPAILNILIAPDGVVSRVYPLNGNEAVIGLDFFSEGAGNKEAIMAKETGQLVFGGPFTLVQGGQALVGRLPVYTYDSSEAGDFWGIVSVTLKYPKALDGVGLDILETQGYAYEIWRTSPDTGEKQIIAESRNYSNRNLRFIEKYIPILNADWYFRVSPVRVWYQHTENWLLIIAGLFVSLMVAFVMQNNHELRYMKSEIENISKLDPLTEIYNRRYFTDTVKHNVEKTMNCGQECFITIFDIDHFKNINDTYGHMTGDEVLKEFADRVENMLRPSDLFARYGGEEFIILFSDIDKDGVLDLMEKIRIAICEEPFMVDNNNINVSVSFGISRVDSAETFEESSKFADKALYSAKESGRNKVVFYAVENKV